MPMKNMMTSVTQYETPNVKKISSLQDSVSSFYSSVDSSEYIVSPAYMSMDREIEHATTSYLANYPEPSYVASYVTNFSAPYATGDIHNSAPHLHNAYSRINGNSIEAQVPSCSAAAYENNDCRGKLAAEFKKLNALHRELEENPCDLAAMHAYESYKKKREEERKACNIRFCPSQPQSFGNASLPKEKTSIRAQQCLPEVNADKVITFDDLSEEQRQGYEVLKNKRKEEFEVLENKLKEEHKAYKKKT
jgi:hypothetical protein